MVCDINIEQKGHYIGYNQFILDNYKKVEQAAADLNIYFLYSFEGHQLLNTEAVSQERIMFFGCNEIDRNSYKGRAIILKKILIICKNKGIDLLLFLDLDQYQLPIFLSSINVPVTGILFRPHHRIQPSNNSIVSLLSTKLMRLKKIMLERLLLSRGFMKSIFILNDEDGVSYLNKKYKRNNFKYLPDPIFTYGSTLLEYKKDRYTFLIFGAISERKNISNIIKAFDLAMLTENSDLLIVGPGESSYQIYLENLIASCKNIDGYRKKIIIKNEFVTDTEMETYFANTDACLVVYKDFYGSSGLLGRAALHGKKIVGSNVGVISEIIKKYRLGTICDPNNVSDIAYQLSNINSLVIENYAGNKFYEEHKPDAFLEVLLAF